MTPSLLKEAVPRKPRESFIKLALIREGELTSKEISELLTVPHKRVWSSLAHMRRKGIVEQESKIFHTPYGDYKKPIVNGKWRLKENQP